MCYYLVEIDCFPKLINFILQGYFLDGFDKCLLIILVYKVLTTSFLIVQFIWYNISTRQFSKNGLVVQSNYHCFYVYYCSLTCCLSTAVLLACITPAAQRFMSGLLQIKHTISPRAKETHLDRRTKLFCFIRFMKMILVKLSVFCVFWAFFVVLCLLIDKFLVHILFFSTSTLKFWDV